MIYAIFHLKYFQFAHRVLHVSDDSHDEDTITTEIATEQSKHGPNTETGREQSKRDRT